MTFPNDPKLTGRLGGFWSRFWRGNRGAMTNLPPDGNNPAKPGSPSEMMPRFDDEPVPPASDSTSPKLPHKSEVDTVPSLHSDLRETPGQASTDEMPVVPPTRAEPIKSCAVCQSPRIEESPYCGECGWQYPDANALPSSFTIFSSATLPIGQVVHEYEIIRGLPCRPGLSRYLARCINPESAHPNVILLAGPRTTPHNAAPAEPDPSVELGQSEPNRDSSTVIIRESALDQRFVRWPCINWERQLLTDRSIPGLPRLLDQFAEGDLDFLVTEVTPGRSLWDAWDDPAYSMQERVHWLIQLTETLHQLHLKGGIIDGLRPELLVLTNDQQLVLADLGDLLPLPLPDLAPIQANLYTAPELILFPGRADARADLYGFGALIYALYLGRELTEMDFEMQGVPKPFVDRFPDAHPMMARIVMKTFAREINRRFPTEDHAHVDPTGFLELKEVLRAAAPVLDRVRLEIGCWTSTGLVRSANEDAFEVIHSTHSRQDELHDQALILLTDGMGGCEAGEVASALAIDTLRGQLLAQPPFQSLITTSMDQSLDASPGAILAQMVSALSEANRVIYESAREPSHRFHGMGCTAEVVYLRGRDLFVAHVGDSRTYHFSRGQLRLVTRDQTLVYRLVELGHLTEEEAMHHPRRNELQQALGGLSIVEPLTYHVDLHPGDSVLICTDGLNNHVDHETLTQVIARAASAEQGARRLINLANLNDGQDNTTVVLIRLL